MQPLLAGRPSKRSLVPDEFCADPGSEGSVSDRTSQFQEALMRKIKSNFFISLDGVVESPDKWHFPYFDDEMGAVVGAGFATTDALLTC
jgi:hypothetical protein